MSTQSEFRYNRLTWPEMNAAIAAQKLVILPTGSTGPLVDLVARKTVLATRSLCFATSYFAFLREAFAPLRESEVVAHADEAETSLYLHLAPERVKMELAVADNDRMGQFVSSDSTRNYPVRFNDFWGRWTQTGVHGDPTKATPEKGRILFEAAVSGLVELVGELRSWPIAQRQDMHRQPVQADIRW